MTTTKQTIVLVNDGQVIWAADRAVLRAALEDLGWTNHGHGRWEEPATEDDDAAAAYIALCGRVRPIEGADIEALRAAGTPTFTARDDQGFGVWSF